MTCAHAVPRRSLLAGLAAIALAPRVFYADLSNSW